MLEPPGAQREEQKPGDEHQPGVGLARQAARHRCGQEHGDARHEHRLADHQRVVAAHHAQIERIEVGEAVEADAQHEGEETAESEVAIGERAQVDDRLPEREHASKEHDRRERRDPGHRQHGTVAEPVVARPLLEHVLERAEEARHRQQADPVEVAKQRPVRLVEVDQGECRGRDQKAGDDVDEEQPVPGERVGQIAADGGADGRRHRRHQADHRRDHVDLGAREDQVGGGEHGRDHAAADEALDRAPDDHLVDVGGEAAHQARRREAARRDRK